MKLYVIAYRVPVALVVGFLLLTSGIRVANGQTTFDKLLKSLHSASDVNDYAGLLNDAERANLEQRCRELREKTGAQFAIVTLKSLEGGEIDDFANKLFQQWGVGKKGQDNGLLLLVAVEDRRARLEVGYGLEPILPDALAGRVLDEQLFPAFRQQRYAAGIQAVVDRVVAIVERNEPAPRDSPGARKQSFGELFMMSLFFAAFVAVGSFLGGAGVGARVVPMMFFGLLFAGIPFLMGCVMAGPWAPLFHAPLGLVLGWFGWSAGRRKPSTFRRSSKRSSGTSGSSWNWPISTGDFGSSSSSWNSGGFSGGWGGFGGGSSGGGGASGSW